MTTSSTEGRKALNRVSSAGKLEVIIPPPSPDSPSIMGTLQTFTDEPRSLVNPGEGHLSENAGSSPNSEGHPARGVGRSRSNRGSMRRRRRGFSFSKDDSYLPDDGRPWRCGEPYRHPLSNSLDDTYWDTLHKLGRSYDIDRCRAWREDIEKVIIFVTLFAATVVAFLVVSLLKLREDPQDTLTTLLIHQIQQQDIYYAGLRNGSFQFANFAPLPPSPPYTPSSSVLRQNGAMLLSVTISLSAVLIGIVCLQWVREYERDSRLGSKEGAALRQMKLDGFETWRIPLIISLLPVLPQVAVGVFFWGLTEMIWGMNHSIATLNLVVIGLVVFFVLFTSIAPAVQNLLLIDSCVSAPQVPFKSILARFFSAVALLFAKAVTRVLKSRYEGDKTFERREGFISKMFKSLTDTSVEDWVAYDMAWQSMRMVTLSRVSAQESRDVPRFIVWVADTHIASRKAITAIYGAMREMYPSTSMQVLRRLLIGEGKNRSETLEASVTKFVERWRLDDDLSKTMMDEGVEDVLEDLKGALVLDQLVKNNPQLQSALLEFRTELFIRVFNHNADSTKPKNFNVWNELEEDKPEWSVRLLVPFLKTKDAKDYLVIRDALKAQIISTFKAYLRSDQYRQMLWKVTLTLVLKTVTCQSSVEEELQKELDTFHHEITQFMKRLGASNPAPHHSTPPWIILLEYTQTYRHFSALRGQPRPTRDVNDGPTPEITFPHEICSGRSVGLYPHLTQFEAQLQELEMLIGSPEGLGECLPQSPSSNS